MRAVTSVRRSRLVAMLLAFNVLLLGCVAALLADRAPQGTRGPGAWLASSAAAEPALGAPAALATGSFIAKSPVADVAHRISPAVVSIGVVKRMMVHDPFANDFFAQFFQPMPAREVRERAPYLGSGSLIDAEGHVITNFHVVEGAEAVFVTLGDGRELPAQFIAGDRYIDLALLRVDAENLPTPIEFGDSDDLQIGETVVALGNPFGPMLEDPRPTVTSGVVSALHRTFRPDLRNQRIYQDMIQTDAAINPGNSGGPLVDIDGRIIGINTFIFSSSGGSQGIGFAIPINRARSLIEEVRTFGHLRQILLDIDSRSIRTPRFSGVLVERVVPDGPAQRAGLAEGDIILGVDARSIRSRDDLLLQLAGKQVGDTLKLTVWRQGETRDLTYHVSEAPSEVPPGGGGTSGSAPGSPTSSPPASAP